MIFMKHRNLEKAVVLSLILSMGVYGSAWAETERPGSLWQEGDYTTQKGNDLEITSDTVGIGPDGTINVVDGDLTVDTSSNSAANGIQSGDETQNKNQVTILANTVTINAGANGIFTELMGASSSVTMGEAGEDGRKIQNLTITSGGQGIDNKNGNVYIYGAADSVIHIHSNTTSGDNYNQAAINNECAGEIIINGGKIVLKTDKTDKNYIGDGITNGRGTTTLNSNEITMDVTGNGISNGSGITTLNSNSILINAEEYGISNTSGTVSLNTKGTNTITAQNFGIYALASGKNGGTINVIASENYDPEKGNSSLDVREGYSNVIFGKASGINSLYDNEINVIADYDNIIGGNNHSIDITTNVKSDKDNVVNITAANNNYIGYKVNENNELVTYGGGIELRKAIDTKVDITSIAGANNIYSRSIGVNVTGRSQNSTVTVTAGTDNNILSNRIGASVGGFYENDSSAGNNVLKLLAASGSNNITIEGKSSATRAGLSTTSGGRIELDALNNNISLTDTGEGYGIESTGKDSQVLLNADNYNQILASENTETKGDGNVYGDKYAVNVESGGNVDVKAGLANTVYGAVYATGENSTVDISKLEQTGTTFSRNTAGEVNNFVRSAAVIDKAGDLDGKEIIENDDGTVTTTGMDVVSALYAEEGASINLSGVNNIQTYYDDPSDTHTSERAVWAYKGADITIEGNTVISTSSYESSPNDMDIAIAAGTSTNINEPIDIANVNLKYENYNRAKSFIKGDILAAYGGEVNIAPNNANTRAVSDAGINITGNLLAGNDGKLDVDLGNGGILVGRADDYGDAALNNGHGSGDKENGFYNPAFSSEIVRNGTVNLTMGEGSQWYVNGQSWITSVDTSKAQNTLIDLVSANTNLNMDSHALTIGTLKGDTNFRMKLDGNRQYSDMLYIGNGNGTYNIELDEVVTIDDMYADSGEGFKFSGLRFATVGKGSDVDFNVTATDKGFNNVIYTVGKDVYDSAESKHENDAYNNGDTAKVENGTSLDKPGNAGVDHVLDKIENETAGTAKINDLILLADEPDNSQNLDNKENRLNYKLIDMQTVRSDAGETMLNMSRANYSNAIYMDRLNKRLGEARYINDDPEEDEGMWVRVRHDRIGKDEAFRSQNTMYELGYDKRQECDNGKRRVGFAVDYMHGDTGYNDIAGKGEIDRYGLWLYDTWTGNKGHYVDYVAKWGHLQNDFEVYNSEGKVTGDYSNNVFSISAEYGRKKDMGNDWYFEPQAQLQLARVTGADYTTSQGTKVSVDGINSLIGRAGFRIGKDFGEEKQSTLYFKADVLHEFLGDQTIHALDGTTNGWQSVDYENQGTWYDIGIGYAAMLSQSTYAFIDLEQSFGNDNDDTYQINAGVRWTF